MEQQRVSDTTERINRGECVYVPGAGYTGTGYLYIPRAKVEAIIAKNSEVHPFGSRPHALEQLHIKVFGSQSLGIEDVVGSSYMMELPSSATSEQAQELIHLIDAEAAR